MILYGPTTNLLVLRIFSHIIVKLKMSSAADVVMSQQYDKLKIIHLIKHSVSCGRSFLLLLIQS